VLDPILERTWNKTSRWRKSFAEGFLEADVLRVARLVDINEYKRRPSAAGGENQPQGFLAATGGIRLTCGFGRD